MVQNPCFRLLDLPVELVMMIIENCKHKERLELLSTCRLIRQMDESYIYTSLQTPYIHLYTETESDGYEMCSLTKETFVNSIAVLNGIAQDDHRRKLIKSLKLSAYCHFMLSRRDIYRLSEELTRTFARHFDKQLESLTYVNTFYCHFVEETPFTFPKLKKLTLGVLIDTVAFDNWLINAPNLEEMNIYCFQWGTRMFSHQEIYSSSIEKLIRRQSNFLLRIYTIEMSHALDNEDDNYNDMSRAIAQVSDFHDLLQHVSMYDVRVYKLVEGALNLNDCYTIVS